LPQDSDFIYDYYTEHRIKISLPLALKEQVLRPNPCVHEEEEEHFLCGYGKPIHIY
jgi:hypothetical protein